MLAHILHYWYIYYPVMGLIVDYVESLQEQHLKTADHFLNLLLWPIIMMAYIFHIVFLPSKLANLTLKVLDKFKGK